MAYDKNLAQRVRERLRKRRGVSEMERFGGIGFLIQGNMACGVLGKELLVRVGPAKHEEALGSRNTMPFAISGRPAKGWVLVTPAGTKAEVDLERWVEMGVRFVRSLPAK